MIEIGQKSFPQIFRQEGLAQKVLILYYSIIHILTCLCLGTFSIIKKESYGTLLRYLSVLVLLFTISIFLVCCFISLFIFCRWLGGS